MPQLELDYLNLMNAAKPESARSGTTTRVAVLGWCTTHYLAQVLNGIARTAGESLEIYEAPFNSVEQSVLDGDSPFYEFAPEFAIFLTAVQTVRDQLSRHDVAERLDRGIRESEHLIALLRRVAESPRVRILVHQWVVPYERPWGNYTGQVQESLANCVRLMNDRLVEAAKEIPNVHLVDCDHIASWLGKERWFDERLWFHGKCFCGLEALPYVASQDWDVIRAVRGKTPKCVVLDLDDTLWGGVIGDDGLDGIQLGESSGGEAFVRFQMYLKQLRERGLILAVCSKNEEEKARQPFRRHPQMVLREEDIACFVANWQNKAENLRTIAARLNIGLDSLVFIDNSPFERDLVRRLLPDVHVPDMPDDPAQFVPFLDSRNLFETVQYSTEDRQRTEFYRDNAKRNEVRESFENVADFLASLEMAASFEPLNEFCLPRVHQLVQRTNQFNLTTIRHSESELRRFSEDPDCFPFCTTLKDRFGDNGLVSVVIGKRQGNDLEIVTWLMSCRVFSRRLEEFMLDKLVEVARQATFDRLLGRYVPTKKNGFVRGLYERLGFLQIGDEADGTTRWELPLEEHIPSDAPIQKINGTWHV